MSSILAITISFSPLWIPVILSIIIIGVGLYEISKPSYNWFDLTGFFTFAFGLMGLLLVWMIYFAVMYFVVK